MKIRWIPLPIVVVLCFGPWMPAAEKAAAKPKPLATPKPVSTVADEGLLKKDLEQIQGVWVRSERTGLFSSRRVTKEIKGDTETVTSYDGDGGVETAHTVKIKLRRSGPIRIFAYSDQTFIAGPDKGQKEEGTKAYVYKVVGNTFVEIIGVWDETTTELTTREWTRLKPGR